MIRSHLRSLTIAAIAAAFGATLVFTVLPSVATAREPRAAPRTKIGLVEVDAKLTRMDDGWVIDVEASNPTDSERPCKVELALTRFVNNPMARVRAMPQRAWQTQVALDVPAHGSVKHRVTLPAKLAGDLTAAELKSAKADELAGDPASTARPEVVEGPPAQLVPTVEYAVVVRPGAVKAAAPRKAAPVRLANAAD